MITIRSLRYLILACLVISLPVQPAGWFNTLPTWKKVGVSVTALIVLDVVLAIIAVNCHEWFKGKFDYRTIVMDRPADLPPDATPDQELSAVVKLMLNRNVDPNFRPNACTGFFVKKPSQTGYTRGVVLIPTRWANFFYHIPSSYTAKNIVERAEIFDTYDYVHGQKSINGAALTNLMNYHKNQAAIAEKAHQFSFQTQCHSEKDIHTANFNPGISDIIGAYAAEEDRDVHEIEELA